MGVSYLVETDDMTILFDTGNNSAGTETSPLEHNMQALGVALENIDAVVISHAHFDHVGGKRWTNGELSGTSFGIGNEQPDLGDTRVITPIAMQYPGSEPEVGLDPVRVGAGVATTGTIPRELLIGWIDEQALAVNVEGKGLVLIVGCGHQTLPRLIERTEQVFDQPIYGVVGGLHYPVPEGRMVKFGVNLQRMVASGDGPLDPITREDIDAELSLLEDRNVGLVGIGGHDSSDEVIAIAEQRFGDAYRRVEVGLPIAVRAADSEALTGDRR
jgi:metal-dependent hydrolase (beta-lactamase superfamily II)